MSTTQILHDQEQWAPNPGSQNGFMDDYFHRYCAFCGGWNSGKTWAGTRKFTSLHVFNALDDNEQPTHVASLVVAQSYQLAMTVNAPKLEEAFDEAGLSYKWIGDPKIMAFQLPDLGTRKRPSLVYLRSADAAKSIAGFEVGQVYGDEAARWWYDPFDPLTDAWLQSDGRLRASKAKVQQFNITYTPEGDNTRCYLDFELRPKKDHILYRAHTKENLHGGVEFAQKIEEQLSPQLAAQYLGGMAMSTTSGKVYAAYNADHNKSDDLVLDRNLPLQLSIDFNIEPGMHGVVGQYDKERNFATSHYVLHSPRMTVLKLVDDLVVLIRNLEIANRYILNQPIEIFGDASGSGEWAATGESMWDVVENALSSKGISYKLMLPAKNPPVSARVNAVNSALYSVIGEVRYLAHSRCTPLFSDWELMHWRDGQIDKRDQKISHPSDADGYRIWYLMPIKRLGGMGHEGPMNGRGKPRGASVVLAARRKRFR